MVISKNQLHSDAEKNVEKLLEGELSQNEREQEQSLYEESEQEEEENQEQQSQEEEQEEELLQEEQVEEEQTENDEEDLDAIRKAEDVKAIQINECKYYLEKSDFSNLYVDGILSTAADSVFPNYETSETKQDQVPNIIWPTIVEFNKALGNIKIKEYIDSTMISTENWVANTQFLLFTSDAVSEFYEYESKFSIPTICYPIPQATLEGFNLIMVPGKDLISDDLLFRVIDMKLAIFRQVTF